MPIGNNTHSFKKYLLNALFVLGTVTDAWDTAVNKED